MKWSIAVLSAIALSFALPLAAPASAAVSGAAGWQWPLSPEPVVVAAFRPPAERWAPGHRGVDLLGSVAQPVSAIGAGTVTFAGTIAGRGVVVVDHGALRSTYEPVTARVERGSTVRAGQVIATLTAISSHCAPRACLHLGVRRGDDYVDPLTLFGPREVRLKPLAGTSPTAGQIDAGGGGPGNAGRLRASPSNSRAAGPDLGRTGTAAAATVAALAGATVDRLRQRRRAVKTNAS